MSRAVDNETTCPGLQERWPREGERFKDVAPPDPPASHRRGTRPQGQSASSCWWTVSTSGSCPRTVSCCGSSRLIRPGTTSLRDEASTMPRHIRPRCADTSQLWTQGDTIQTPLRICKRFSATVNRSVARQPSRGRERDSGEAPLAHLVSSAVTRQAKRSLQNPCPLNGQVSPTVSTPSRTMTVRERIPMIS